MKPKYAREVEAALQAALDDYYGRATEAEMDSLGYREEEEDDE